MDYGGGAARVLHRLFIGVRRLLGDAAHVFESLQVVSELCVIGPEGGHGVFEDAHVAHAPVEQFNSLFAGFAHALFVEGDGEDEVGGAVVGGGDMVKSCG